MGSKSRFAQRAFFVALFSAIAFPVYYLFFGEDVSAWGVQEELLYDDAAAAAQLEEKSNNNNNTRMQYSDVDATAAPKREEAQAEEAIDDGDDGGGGGDNFSSSAGIENSEKKKRQRVVLHVGPHKTASTSIQTNLLRWLSRGDDDNSDDNTTGRQRQKQRRGNRLTGGLDRDWAWPSPGCAFAFNNWVQIMLKNETIPRTTECMTNRIFGSSSSTSNSTSNTSNSASNNNVNVTTDANVTDDAVHQISSRSLQYNITKTQLRDDPVAVLEYYRRKLYDAWMKGYSLAISSEVIDRVTKRKAGGPLLENIIRQFPWHSADYVPPASGGDEDVTVVVVYRSPRIDHLQSMWRQQTMKKTVDVTNKGMSFYTFVTRDTFVNRDSLTSLDSLFLAKMFLDRGLKVVLVDLAGVSAAGYDISYVIACDVLEADCTPDKRFVGDEEDAAAEEKAAAPEVTNVKSHMEEAKNVNVTADHLGRMNEVLEEYDCNFLSLVDHTNLTILYSHALKKLFGTKCKDGRAKIIKEGRGNNKQTNYWKLRAAAVKKIGEIALESRKSSHLSSHDTSATTSPAIGGTAGGSKNRNTSMTTSSNSTESPPVSQDRGLAPDNIASPSSLPSMFDWSDVDTNHPALCGYQKCFFQSRTTTRQTVNATAGREPLVEEGYLVANTCKGEGVEDYFEAIQRTWNAIQQLEKEPNITFRHFYLEPPYKLHLPSKDVVDRLNSVTLHNKNTTHKHFGENTTYNSCNSTHVVVQKVRAAPRVHIVPKCHFMGNKNVLLYLPNVNKTEFRSAVTEKWPFLRAFKEELRRLSKVMEKEPRLWRDFQFLIDTDARIYHIDVDRMELEWKYKYENFGRFDTAMCFYKIRRVLTKILNGEPTLTH